MDPNDFKQRLEELAVIKDTKPTGKPKMIKEVHLDEDGEEYIVMVPEEQYNPTMPFKLEKVKTRTEACAMGCGKIVDNQVIEKRLALTPQRHWRTRCQSCGYYLHPTGEGFIEGGHLVAQEYIKFFRKDPEPVDKQEYLKWLEERKSNQ